LLKSLPRGGIETWLTHVFHHSADAPVRHEVLLMQESVGPYEARVSAAGVPIHILPVSSWPAWFLGLHRLLRQEGPFAVFHAHVDSIISGPATCVAALAGVPVRIMHNHAARALGADYQAWHHKLREIIGCSLGAKGATRRVAISEAAMLQLAGARWQEKENCTVLLYGFDYSAFTGASDRALKLRSALGIPEGARVIGHVGRFASQKNHSFLIRIFAAFAARDSRAVLVLVGTGTLEADVRAQVSALGLQSRVLFAGGTDDIAAFMSLFDIFILPSFSEGLGIVALEAQAAGTPVLMPLNMPREVIVVNEAVTLLDLADGPEAWAASIEKVLGSEQRNAAEWLDQVEKSAFGMSRCVDDLNAIYAEEIGRYS
jgi:glycosyltransferase involved in cell wall biosynthesis